MISAPFGRAGGVGPHLKSAELVGIFFISSAKAAFALPTRKPKQSIGLASSPPSLSPCRESSPGVFVSDVEITTANQSYQLLRMQFVAANAAIVLQRHRALMAAIGACISVRE